MNWRFWDKSANDSCNDSCAAIEPLLSLLSDDMASAAEKRRVEAHLAACPDCRQALEWMQATRQVISLRPAVAPPADLRARIARAIAEADAAQAPAVTSPARPARRLSALRPALAYGFSLVLCAGIAGDLAWNATRPAGTRVAVQPVVKAAPAPLVASNIPPQTSAAVVSTLHQFNETLRLSLTGPLPSPVRHPVLRPARVFRAVPAPPETAPAPEPARIALKPHTPTVPRLSPLPRKAPQAITHMAVKPAHSTVAPRLLVPAPHMNDQQIARADVPPRVEMHTPTVTPPAVPVNVGPPTITHDPSQVAERSPSTREVLSHFVAGMHTVALTSNASAVNGASRSAAADISTERLGYASIVSGPVH